MFSKRARMWLGLIAALSLLSLASSCGPKTGTDDNTAGDNKGKPYVSKGDEGTVTERTTPRWPQSASTLYSPAGTRSATGPTPTRFPPT